jgi:hypothetical protein
MSEPAPDDVPGPFTARLNGQDLKPGDEGYWKVWGACAMDIQPGDLVMSGWKDEDYTANGIIRHAEYEVAEMASFTAPTMNTLRVGFIDTTGKFASVGMLQPCAIVRWGTGNFLSDYAR